MTRSMTIRYDHLKQRPFEPVRQHYGERDTMLYALSLGLGSDPLCADALPFFYEGAPGGLRALPSQAVVLGYPGFWAREADTGIDWVKLLHGEQRMRLHRPLPASADVVGHNRITHLTDKGERSEEHTSELQSPCNLVCRLLLEKKSDFLRTGPKRGEQHQAPASS